MPKKLWKGGHGNARELLTYFRHNTMYTEMVRRLTPYLPGHFRCSRRHLVASICYVSSVVNRKNSMCLQKYVMVNISIMVFGKMFEKNTTIFHSYLLTSFCSKKCIPLPLGCCSSCGLCVPKKNPYISISPYACDFDSCVLRRDSFDCFCPIFA
jgi:hypothetical protein